jgi:uncharacterized protein YcaQ
MAFGTVGDIQKFWDATHRTEVRDWATHAEEIVPVEIESHDGNWTEAFAGRDIQTRLIDLRRPTTRLRIINPFDPAIRDRARFKRLFGMDFKIEIFVPATKRQYGYYVYPILEGDKFIGRVELKGDRKRGELYVHQIWLEPKMKWTAARDHKFDAELRRMARFIGVDDVHWICNRPA